ncbi:hypothetical protein BDK51DRAFT_43229 [Blyttiomyces helicus]|uniref:Uncharacterized protein n=1 Tax=Blyttiomyces helicus TaxID=388810 RepID=A0A4P9W2S3_9FUNG|nr:hypothetical protein BDK51DRAFT_43229 [Blyttiomyces helicus]|eukprot:RKO86541.1 hypothetical protein BDK51DRAFT_43229 [Blyttiomyces helicus]
MVIEVAAAALRNLEQQGGLQPASLAQPSGWGKAGSPFFRHHRRSRGRDEIGRRISRDGPALNCHVVPDACRRAHPPPAVKYMPPAHGVEIPRPRNFSPATSSDWWLLPISMKVLRVRSPSTSVPGPDGENSESREEEDVGRVKDNRVRTHERMAERRESPCPAKSTQFLRPPVKSSQAAGAMTLHCRTGACDSARVVIENTAAAAAFGDLARQLHPNLTLQTADAGHQPPINSSEALVATTLDCETGACESARMVIETAAAAFGALERQQHPSGPTTRDRWEKDFARWGEPRAAGNDDGSGEIAGSVTGSRSRPPPPLNADVLAVAMRSTWTQRVSDHRALLLACCRFNKTCSPTPASFPVRRSRASQATRCCGCLTDVFVAYGLDANVAALFPFDNLALPMFANLRTLKITKQSIANFGAVVTIVGACDQLVWPAVKKVAQRMALLQYRPPGWVSPPPFLVVGPPIRQWTVTGKKDIYSLMPGACQTLEFLHFKEGNFNMPNLRNVSRPWPPIRPGFFTNLATLAPSLRKELDLRRQIAFRCGPRPTPLTPPSQSPWHPLNELHLARRLLSHHYRASLSKRLDLRGNRWVSTDVLSFIALHTPKFLSVLIFIESRNHHLITRLNHDLLTWFPSLQLSVSPPFNHQNLLLEADIQASIESLITGLSTSWLAGVP